MAGYEETNAPHEQGQVVGNPSVKKEIRRLLEEKGMTDAHAVERLYQATNALETKFHQGVPVANCVAHDIRLEAVRTFLQLTGRLTNRVDIELVVKQFTDQVMQVIEQYVPAEKRGDCLDKIIRMLSTAGVN